MLELSGDLHFLDGMLRGFRNRLLTTAQYSELMECNSLKDLQQALMQYGLISDEQTLINDTNAILTPVGIERAARDVFCAHFHTLLSNTNNSVLLLLLEYVRTGYAIDNTILMVRGVVQGWDQEDLRAKCHPLGVYDVLPAISAFSSHNPENDAESEGDADLRAQMEAIQGCLLATEHPLLKLYFEHCLPPPHSTSFLAQTTAWSVVERLRAHLHKAYLEDFLTWARDELEEEDLVQLLALEADRRILATIILQLGSEHPQRDSLRANPFFPCVGNLWESGAVTALSHSENIDRVVEILSDCLPSYRVLFASENNPYEIDTIEGSGAKTLEDLLTTEEIRLCLWSFTTPFSFAPFYAWMRLREQELRNIRWIAECIVRGKQEVAQNRLVTPQVKTKPLL